MGAEARPGRDPGFAVLLQEVEVAEIFRRRLVKFCDTESIQTCADFPNFWLDSCHYLEEMESQLAGVAVVTPAVLLEMAKLRDKTAAETKLEIQSCSAANFWHWSANPLSSIRHVRCHSQSYLLL